MKKFLKTSLLVLFTAMLFAGCKNQTSESGPSANTPIEEEEFKSANWLTDGDWVMDSVSKSEVSMPGYPSQPEESKMHIEMTVEGDDITVTKATVTVDGEEEEVTEQINMTYSSKEDVADSSNLSDEDSMAYLESLGINISEIEPEIKYYKNEDGTEFRITIKTEAEVEIGGPMAMLMEMPDGMKMNIKQTTEAVYKKQ